MIKFLLLGQVKWTTGYCEMRRARSYLAVAWKKIFFHVLYYKQKLNVGIHFAERRFAVNLLVGTVTLCLNEP